MFKIESERAGLPSGFFKFATMLKKSPNMGAGTVTVENDLRVLPIGKFLRKTKLNELPQLINVVTGDLSLIGPRQQTIRYFEAFPACYSDTEASIKPGLSGLGSIILRNEEELLGNTENSQGFYDNAIMPYKAELECWFVDNYSFRLFLCCIFSTWEAILFKRSTLLRFCYPSIPVLPRVLKDKGMR